MQSHQPVRIHSIPFGILEPAMLSHPLVRIRPKRRTADLDTSVDIQLWNSTWQGPMAYQIRIQLVQLADTVTSTIAGLNWCGKAVMD